ncbi:MAG: tetratricopeptide repeat protein [Elusimicrobiota bacterium]
MKSANKRLLAAKRKWLDYRMDQIVMGLDQLTAVDAADWSGYAMWRPLAVDPHRFGGVVFDLDKALEKAPEDVEALAMRGRALRIVGDFKGALADLRRALELRPDDGYARACLGELRLAMGEEGQAADAFSRAERGDPDMIWTYVWRGAWALLKGDLTQAGKDLETLRVIGEEKVVINLLAGVLSTKLRDFKEAIRLFDRAAVIDSHCGGTLVMRGHSRLWDGDEKGAAADYEEAIRFDHDCKVGYYQIIGCGDLEPTAKDLAFLDGAIRKRPDAAWLYGLRSEILRMPKLSLYLDSVKDLEKAVELDPKSPWLMAFLGRGYAQTGQPERGVECLYKAVKLDPTCGWVIAWRGEAVRIAGKFKEAIDDLTKAIKYEPYYMYSYVWRGGLYRLMEREREALADLDFAMTLHPRYPHGYHQRAFARLYAGMGKEAMEDMAQAVRFNPKYSWVHGKLAGREKEWRRVLKGLDTAVAQEKKGGWPLAWRGEARLKLGDWEGALEDLAAAVKRDPKLAWGWAWLGETKIKLGKAGSALPDLQKATQLDPTYARAWSWKGAALSRLGRCPLALEAFNEAMRLDPRSAWAWGWRGEVKLRVQDFEGALKDLDKALTFDLRFVEAHMWRGEALAGLGRFEDAIVAIDRALEFNPEHAMAYVTRALAKEKLGDFFGEMLDFARALKFMPELMDKTARERLSEQLMERVAEKLESGDPTAALEAAEAVLGFDPGNADAQAVVRDTKRSSKDGGSRRTRPKGSRHGSAPRSKPSREPVPAGRASRRKPARLSAPVIRLRPRS